MDTAINTTFVFSKQFYLDCISSSFQKNLQVNVVSPSLLFKSFHSGGGGHDYDIVYI